MEGRKLHCFLLTILILILCGRLQAQVSWDWQSPYPQGNTLYSIHAFDQNSAIAAGELGVIVKTNNGGLAWSRQSSPVKERLNSAAFLNADTGYIVGAKGVILRTGDGGTNWLKQSLAGVSAELRQVYYLDSQNILIVGDEGRIIRSSDGGGSWAQVQSGVSLNLNSVFFLNNTTGWIACAGGTILKTTDGGNQWTKFATGRNTDLYSVYFRNADTGFAVGNSGVLLKSFDGGKTWSFQFTGSSDDLRSVKILPNGNIYLAGKNGTLLKSVNDAKNFTREQAGTASDLNCLSMTPSGDALWSAGRFGTVCRRISSEGVWKKCTAGGGRTLHSVFIADENKGWAAGDAGLILKTTDSGQNWTGLNTGISDTLFSILFLNENKGWAAGSNGKIIYTENGGELWKSQQSGITSDSIMSVCFIDSLTGWAAGSRGVILRTNDGGSTWARLESGVSGTIYSISFADASKGWAVGQQGLMLSTEDGGEHWTAANSGVTQDLLTIRYVSSSSIWAAGTGGTILKLSGSGIWEKQPAGTGRTVRALYFFDNLNGWAAGDSGLVMYTSDGGINWNEEETVTDNSFHAIGFANAGAGWLAGEGETIIKYTWQLANEIQLSADQLEVLAGDTVCVDVNVKFPLSASFSSAEVSCTGFVGKMKFLSVETLNTLSGEAGWIEMHNMTDSVLYLAFIGAKNISGTGTLFRLKFAVPAGTLPGFIPVLLKSASFNTGINPVKMTSGGLEVLKVTYGDVDLNNKIQAYDAAQILKYLTGSVILNSQQLKNADVSGDNEVSSFDASTILRYVVHLVGLLPDTAKAPQAEGNIAMNDVDFGSGSEILVPVEIRNGANIYSLEGLVEYDQQLFRFQGVEPSAGMRNFTIEAKAQGNSVRIAAAARESANPDGVVLKMRFRKTGSSAAGDSKISLKQFRMNQNKTIRNAADSKVIAGANSSVPGQYIMEQNYPNPFNPMTNIRYGLPELSRVHISIYNSLGELVEDVEETEKPAGYHNLKWNAENYTSGLYLIHISARSLQSDKRMEETRKMMLIK